MSLYCKCGGIFGNQPMKIPKWSHFKDYKWSRHKIENFWGGRDFLALLNGTSDSEGHFGGQKSRGPLKKSRFCARDHIESLKWPHLVIFKGWFPNIPPHLQYSDINSYKPRFRVLGPKQAWAPAIPPLQIARVMDTAASISLRTGTYKLHPR